ncbi:MAG: glycosyltransferase family A protein, partial [Aquihabitans sp.]
MSVSLSIIVVVYDMARELPRTLRTLSPGHQRGIGADDYEVIVVDNGSPQSVDPALVAGFGGHIRVERIDPAPPSPARAANIGLGLARGDLVGLVVD